MPTGREGYGAAEVDGTLYYATGLTTADDDTVHEAYDPNTDTWDPTVADLPGDGRSEAVAAADGTFVYLIGGRPPSSVGDELWRYDPGADSWTQLADMPTERATEHMAAHHDGNLYVAGGRQGNSPGSGPRLADLEIYDISSDSWSSGASMPEARSDATLLNQGSTLYVFGGFDSSGNVTDGTFIYDIPSDSWMSGSPMPEPRANPAGGSCGNKLHVIGGHNPSGTIQDSHFVYDPAADSWSNAASIPNGTAEAQGVSHGGQIFVAGGGIFGSGEDNDLNQVFHCPAVEVEIDIKHCSDPNAINPDAKGVIPVGIKHTPGFDPNHTDTGVDVGSLRFGAPDVVAGGDGAAPAHGGHVEDVVPCEGDGDDDLVVHFPTEDTGFDGDEDVGRLEGETNNGKPLFGEDSVKIVGRGDGGGGGGGPP